MKIINELKEGLFEGAVCFLVMLPFAVAGLILLLGYPYEVANFYAYITAILCCIIMQIVIHFDNKSRKK